MEKEAYGNNITQSISKLTVNLETLKQLMVGVHLIRTVHIKDEVFGPQSPLTLSICHYRVNTYIYLNFI